MAVDAAVALGAGTALALGAALVVLGPLWKGDADAPPSEGTPERGAAGEARAEGVSAVEALREIEFDRATGKLSDDDYAALKTAYTRDALAELRAADGKRAGAAAAVAAPVGTDPVEDALRLYRERQAFARAAGRADARTCPVDGPRPEADAVFWPKTPSSFAAPASTTSRTSTSPSRATSSRSSPGCRGVGKSSLAFDTIYAEGQRRYVESLSAYARQFLGLMEKPDVDVIEGLSPAISIEQKNAGNNPRSTVGTVTEIYDYLRLLWARAGTPHCANCGRPVQRQSPAQIAEAVLAWPEGTRIEVRAPLVQGRKGEFRELFEDVRKQGFVRAVVDGAVIELAEPPKLNRGRTTTSRVVVDRLVVRATTAAASPTRSRPRSSSPNGLVEVVEYPAPGGERLPRRRRARLPHAQPLGGRSPAARRSASGSPRRSARARRRALRPRRAVDRAAPARQRAADRDAAALRDLGNTLIVVEHDEETIARPTGSTSGPGAGEHGGQVSPPARWRRCCATRRRSPASTCPAREIPVPPSAAARRRARAHPRRERAASTTCATSTSRSRSAASSPSPACPARASRRWSTTSCTGAGASTLPRAACPGAHDRITGLEHLDKVIDIDQSPIGRTPRSNPATYTGVFTTIRELFAETPEAKVRGYLPGRFSFNVKGGRCEACQGDGTIKIEMHFLPDVYVPCEVCKGALQPRDARGALQGQDDRRRARHAVEEACEFFEASPAHRAATADAARRRARLRPARPAATTLSGGEAQRVKLASELQKRTPAARSTSSTSRPPACTSRTSASCSRCCTASSTGQHGARHRAQPRRDQDGRLGHRHGARGRLRRRHVVAQGTPEQVAWRRASANGCGRYRSWRTGAAWRPLSPRGRAAGCRPYSVRHRPAG
jgi:hypothetical protein